MGKPKGSRAVDPLTTLTVAAVAPAWLQEPLAVLLNAGLFTRQVASATDVEELLAAEIDAPPDLVLLYADQTGSQVQRVKATWPGTRCIVLVEHRYERQAAREAGADEVLLQGVAPGRLLAAIDGLRDELIKAHDGVGLAAKG